MFSSIICVAIILIFTVTVFYAVIDLVVSVHDIKSR